jgi:hypothetical protein
VAHAIGASVSMSAGIAVNYGTMTKPLHCGNAARNGVLAALLASKGFTSHVAAFEGDNGFFASFGRAMPSNYAPFNDLGSRWDLKEIGYSIKYYPCGGRGHTAIEAALILRDKARVEDIANIHCWMSPSSAKRVNTKYPGDVEAAKFSAAYVLAYSLIHGIPKINAFTTEALQDARVKALAGLVTASADPNLSDAVGENPTRVKITLKKTAIAEFSLPKITLPYLAPCPLRLVVSTYGICPPWLKSSVTIPAYSSVVEPWAIPGVTRLVQPQTVLRSKPVFKPVTKVVTWLVKVTMFSAKLAVGLLNWPLLVNCGKKSSLSLKQWTPSRLGNS